MYSSTCMCTLYTYMYITLRGLLRNYKYIHMYNVHVGFDQSITTTSSSSSENELGGGLSDEYEDYEEREEESVPLNTNSYFEDDSGSITDLPKSSSVNMKKQQKLNRKVNTNIHVQGYNTSTCTVFNFLLYLQNLHVHV